MSKIKIGSKVEWVCKSGCGDHFKCKGTVIDTKMSTFGSCRKGMGASIKVNSKKYHNLYGKKKAFISVSNLTLV